MTSILRVCFLCCLCGFASAWAHGEKFNLKLDVQQQGRTFVTNASFKLPLNFCQAWLYLTDYDAATNIPGIIASRTTPLGNNLFRVERSIKDSILFFPIRMNTVTEFKQLPEKGTDFVQIEGKAKSHRGSWRLEEQPDGTVYRYHAVSEPDSLLPMAVIKYFINNRLESSFAAMAENGAARKDIACH